MNKLKEVIKKFEKFELHHKITSFLLVMFLTILCVRLYVFFHNPNVVLFNFELHHFDYGLLMLLITCLFLLFSNMNHLILLFSSGISFGLIIDDLWFIRSNINDPLINEISIYNSTFFSVIILSIFITFLIIMIDHFNNKT